MDDLTGAERLARRSRAVTIAALALLTLLAWAWLLQGAGMHSADMPMDGMAMPWDANRFLLVASMWWVMMIAMMLPSAAPVIMLFARVHRHSGDSPPTAPFLAGYLAVWLGFALLAALLQGLLEQRGIVSASAMALPDGWPAAGLLFAAGLYQLTSLKDACLASCRTPSEFLTSHYRPGPSGAWRMGLIHGAYCVGCCWLLMALLFVGGVMNLAWIAALTLLVAAEKLLPGGPWIARISGAGLILWGAAILVD
jgi:predicted metal-binding membrane protein